MHARADPRTIIGIGPASGVSPPARFGLRPSARRAGARPGHELRGNAMAGMVAEDVYELTGVADPRLSPDGTTVAYVVGTVDKDANEYGGAIWLAAVDGSA